MKLSTSTIQFTKLPIEKALERIAALGFEAVDIWSGHAGCPHLDDVAKRLGAAGLKEQLAKHKLKLYSFSVYRGGYAKYAKLLGEAGGGVAVRGSRKGGALTDAGMTVKAYDPVAGGNAARQLAANDRFVLLDSQYDPVDGADALAVVTDWNQFRNPDFVRIQKMLKTLVVFDGRNLYSRSFMKDMGFSYISIGRQPVIQS